MMIIIQPSPTTHVLVPDLRKQLAEHNLHATLAWTERFNGRYGYQFVTFIGFDTEEEYLKFKLINTDKWELTENYPKTWGWDGELDF